MNAIKFLQRAVTERLCDLKLRVQFAGRTDGDVQELNELLGSTPCGAFRDVTRYRDGASPDLRHQAELLSLGNVCVNW